MAEIFLSYGRDDAAVARRFAEAFEREGLNVWWDAALRSGEAYDAVIEATLKLAKAVVVLWSPRSVASRWVRAEATVADRNRTFVPVTIERCERPIMFELTQTADLSHWRGDPADAAWRELVGHVQQLVAGAPADASASPPPPAPPPAPPTLPAGSVTVIKFGQRGKAPSLAVLPFANRSGLAEDDVFAEGMVEDVIAALSQGVNLTVLSSMATAGLRRQAITDLAALGERLGVRYLLEGNVRRVAQQLRVTAQILEAETGAVLWSGRFDRPLVELAELQEDLVTELAASLDVQVRGIELQRILKKPSDLTAWEAMMRSYSLYQKLDGDSLARALKEAHRAAAIAPDYAAAHAQIALASAVIYLITSPDDAAEVARIGGLVDAALALDAEDPVVLVAIGCALNYIGRPADAAPHLKRAVRKAPGDGMAHYHMGIAACLLDRHDEAIAHLDQAIRLFAGSPLLYLNVAWRAGALVRAGKWTEGEAGFDEALAMNERFAFARAQKAVCRLHAGDDAAARALFAPLASNPDYDQRQCETMLRRVFGTSDAADAMLTGVRNLWGEATRAA